MGQKIHARQKMRWWVNGRGGPQPATLAASRR
jgi:hypothetical protein